MNCYLYILDSFCPFRTSSDAMTIDSQSIEEHNILSNDPLSARGLVHWQLRLARHDWQTLVNCLVGQTSTEKTFRSGRDITDKRQ